MKLYVQNCYNRQKTWITFCLSEHGGTFKKRTVNPFSLSSSYKLPLNSAKTEESSL